MGYYQFYSFSMKKFLAIYTAPHAALEEMMKTMTPEKSKESMEEWRKWMAEHKESFVEEGAPVGKNKRVSADGISDVRNDINGFSIVQAESHEEAAKIFQGNPQMQMPGSYVEVLELVKM